MPQLGDLIAVMKVDATEAHRGFHEMGEGLHELRDTFMEVAAAIGVGFGIEQTHRSGQRAV